MPQNQGQQSNLLACFCHLCNGTRQWTQATISRHYNLQSLRSSLLTIPSIVEESRPNSIDAEEFSSNEEDLPIVVVSISSNLQATQLDSEPLNLHDAIVIQTINLQVYLDKSYISVESQGKIIQGFFGDFSKNNLGELRTLDYINFSLEKGC